MEWLEGRPVMAGIDYDEYGQPLPDSLANPSGDNGFDQWAANERDLNGRGGGPAAAAPAPSGNAMSEQQVGDWLRSRGIDEATIKDEAGYVARSYADPDEDPIKVLEQSLPFYMQRTLSGGDRGNGGYDTNENDPQITVGNYTAPARRDSDPRGKIPAPRQYGAGGLGVGGPGVGYAPGPGAFPGGVFNGGGSTVPGQFTDPITSYLEQFAQTRAQQLENPPANSGQNLLETALRSIAGQFGQGGYTDQQQETLNTQAIEPLEQLRAERKRQILQSLSQRGIDPQSGVGQQMVGDVDRQFDQLIMQQRRALANQATQEQQSRMLQSVNLLQQLAGGENARLDSAYRYRSVPMNLADRAFGQASSLYNATGNPLAVVQGLQQLAASQQAQQSGLSEALGYLAYQLANG